MNQEKPLSKMTKIDLLEAVQRREQEHAALHKLVRQSFGSAPYSAMTSLSEQARKIKNDVDLIAFIDAVFAQQSVSINTLRSERDRAQDKLNDIERAAEVIKEMFDA